jgi:hypothetical protein
MKYEDIKYKGDLIVSRYNEDVSWLSEFYDNYRIFLYNKGDHIEGSINLPNVGREGSTYLTHIIYNYDNLDDWVFFTQGNPFDHVRNYKKILREFPHTTDSTIFENPNQLQFFCDDVRFKKILYSKPNGYPHDRRGMDINEVWIKLFTDPPLKLYPFTRGAIFAVSRDTIRMRSVDFYKKANELCVNNYLGPWIFERLFISIFDNTKK